MSSPAEAANRLGPGFVLIIEDEPLVRLMLADDLQSAGFDVLQAATGDEGLDVLKAEPDIRVVLADLQMPGNLKGRELVRTIRAQFPATKVLVLSAYALDTELASLVRGSFLKPVDPWALVQATRLLIDE